MVKHKTIGIDLAKNSFYFVVLNEYGKRITRKKLNRKQVLPYLASQELSIIAMEACSSAHYWGREIKKLGHEVQLLPPQHVKGYLRGQKNDYNDAQAIAEVSQHGAIRTVAIKTIEQQDRQSILHMRRFSVVLPDFFAVNKMVGAICLVFIHFLFWNVWRHAFYDIDRLTEHLFFNQSQTNAPHAWCQENLIAQTSLVERFCRCIW